MKHIWSILCQASIRDQETHRTSIINVVETIGFIVDKKKLLEKKYIPTNLQILSMWSNSKRDNKELTMKVSLINSNGKILNNSEKNISRANDKGGLKKARSATTRTFINSLPIINAGQYYFRISQKNKNEKKFKVVAELPLEIKIKYRR